jgi:hypothetical protein
MPLQIFEYNPSVVSFIPLQQLDFFQEFSIFQAFEEFNDLQGVLSFRDLPRIRGITESVMRGPQAASRQSPSAA